MSLKRYQQKALDALQAFLQAVPLYGVQGAFEKIRALDPPRIKGSNKLPDFQPLQGLQAVPYVCLRLPTGGGKTLLCAHSIPLYDKTLESGFPLCLWLVPSDTIRRQTLETLKNPAHLNARALQEGFGEAYRVFDISEYRNIRPQDLEQYACIIVCTFAALRVDKTEGRHAYRYEEELEAHFTPDDEKHPELEREAEKGNRIKKSFVNLLHIKRPLVLVDEAHNAKSPLSLELLKRINPSAVIEYTATPAGNSNILLSVTAQELKDEQMIKLPIHLQTHKSWQQAVSASIAQRHRLEPLAQKERQTLRPLVLFQAENKNAQVTVDVLKEHLITQEKIPAEQIAIATGNQRELDDINLFDPYCPIKYIITVQALKEGWDCSFAYVLCSVANTQSATAAEQLLGRVLRMPYASARSSAELNCAYAHVTQSGWPNAVTKMHECLTGMGFERHETEGAVQVQDELPGMEGKSEYPPFIAPLTEEPDLSTLSSDEQSSIKVQEEAGWYSLQVQHPNAKLLEKIAQSALSNAKDRGEFNLRRQQWLRQQVKYQAPAERGVVFAVPQLCLYWGSLAVPLELEPCLPPQGWNPLEYYRPMTEEEFSVDKTTNVLVIDIKNEKIRFAQNEVKQLPLRGVSSEITLNDLGSVISRQLGKVLPEKTKATMGADADSKLRQYVDKALQDLSWRADITLSLLSYHRVALQDVLKERLLAAQRTAFAQAFQAQLFGGSERVGVDARHVFQFPPEHYPIRKPYDGNKEFKHHYYRQIADMNAEEAECAWALERLPALKHWVRNLEREPQRAFWLQTSTDRFYPDFVAELEDGRILLVEYKGGHLDNDDTREKAQIGKLWAQKSGHLFVMLWKKDAQGRDMDAQLKQALQSS